VLLGLGGVPARATVFCVPGPCPGGMPQATVAGAINQSNANPDHDTIQIAAGTYHEDLPQVQSGKPVDIVGAGPAQTVLSPLTQGDFRTALTIADPNSTVSNLGIELPQGSGGTGNGETGLSLGGSGTPGSHATNLAITSPGPVKSSSGVNLFSGNERFSGGTISLPKVAAPDSNIGTVGPGTIEDSRITADDGTSQAALVQRTRIDADFRGLDSFGGARYEDVTVVLTGAAPNAVGLDAPALIVPVSVTARHLTLIGNGDSSSIGASCTGGGPPPPQPCSMTLDGVVIRGFGKDLRRITTSSTANISIDYSDYDPAKVVSADAGGGGAITPGAHNVNVDPGFVSSDPANPAAFHLLASSPLVDAGNPALPGDESTTDGAGAPRVIAGRNTSPAVSDIGAFEFQPHAPSAAATGPSTGKTGQPLAFDASASSDPDPGDSLTYSWAFDDGAVAVGPTVSHAFAFPGVHTATVTVTDLSRRSATAPVTTTVSMGPLRILSLMKKADRKTVRPRGRVGFTITAANGEDAAIALRSLSDRLPAGFRYVRGSATLNGKPVTDPRIAGRSLTWSSPVRRVKKKKHGHRTLGARIQLSAPAHGKLRLHLLTIAAKKPGKYTNRASAVAGPTVAVGTQGAGATVRVTAH
jgi:uncharacterized repeat protein (TIGR01451 family)